MAESNHLFNVTKQNDKHNTARTGTLNVNGKPPVKTPAYLVETLGGSLHGISVDLVQELPIELALIDMTNFPSLSQVKDPTKLYALPENTCTFACSNCLKQSDMVSDRGVMINTTNGRKELTPKLLTETSVKLLKTDFLISLSDDPNSSCGSKRIKKSVDRNVKWLKECNESLSHIHSDEAITVNRGADVMNPAPSSSSSSSLFRLIGVVNGGLNPYETKRSIDSVMLTSSDGDDNAAMISSCAQSANSGGGGVLIGGIGCGESPSDRLSIVQNAIKQLPSHSFRMTLHGFMTPSEILDAVSLGVDIISTPLPTILTKNGQALSLPFTLPQPLSIASISKTEGSRESETTIEVSHQIMNLRDAKYRRDPTPMVGDCSCHACVHHTRAYIHHLLIAHELLGEVLLNMHNHHHLLQFFSAIRAHIENGTFEEYHKSIAQPPLPTTS